MRAGIWSERELRGGGSSYRSCDLALGTIHPIVGVIIIVGKEGRSLSIIFKSGTFLVTGWICDV